MPFTRILLLAASLTLLTVARGAIKDTPFKQDLSIHYPVTPDLQDAEYLKLVVNRSGVPFVLTDKGVARLFDSTLALDRSFRPLADRKPLDLAVSNGELFYLYDDQLISNGAGGKILVRLPPGSFDRMAIANDGTALLVGGQAAALVRNGQLLPLAPPVPKGPKQVFAAHNDFLVSCNGTLFRLAGSQLISLRRIPDLTAVASRGSDLLIATSGGYFALNLQTLRDTLPLQTRLPGTNLTSLAVSSDALWAGTSRGVFRRNKDGRLDYYASRRWLLDDRVIDLQEDPNGDLLVLTAGGLNRIQFKTMTLAEKAAFYDRKIRERHIRFGFCSELRLRTPGDITSAEMIDTDNDGTWSNYYLASQAFRFGATKSEQARRNAWETFEALERLEAITGLDGFPARTFERAGFKFSDPDRWNPTRDGQWEWKGTTSSDEITAHTFGCAALWECVAKTPEEKARVSRFYDRIISHIVRNNLYLIDADGKPTLWGRWNPEYVNHYPPSIVDRRLNSAEIIGMLQFAYAITGNPTYSEKAVDLLTNYGYLANILSPMRGIQPTRGFVHEGHDMGDVWNHSDDLLGFVADWVLYRYALNDQLRAQYAASIRDHWEIEKPERCPLWSFVHASTGATDFDVTGALWTLRRYPLDLIDWSVSNSHRNDLTRLPSNFRGQETAELLPPGERRIMRWNGNPFVLDGGGDGHGELAGDEFLLPYWMARYLKIIE